jgi:DNA-directed RNA polymerase subunit RPC12/RpoP
MKYQCPSCKYVYETPPLNIEFYSTSNPNYYDRYYGKGFIRYESEEIECGECGYKFTLKLEDL